MPESDEQGPGIGREELFQGHATGPDDQGAGARIEAKESGVPSRASRSSALPLDRPNFPTGSHHEVDSDGPLPPVGDFVGSPLQVIQ